MIEITVQKPELAMCLGEIAWSRSEGKDRFSWSDAHPVHESQTRLLSLSSISEVGRRGPGTHIDTATKDIGIVCQPAIIIEHSTSSL